MEELKICKEIINKVKWYTERKDYNGLKLYIDEKKNLLTIILLIQIMQKKIILIN